LQKVYEDIEKHYEQNKYTQTQVDKYGIEDHLKKL